MTYTIYLGSNLDILPTLPDNSVDAIVTDPPYGLSDNKFVAETITRWINGQRDFIPDGKGFMGKAWDAFVPPPALWDECLRVLKPGGHLLAFFGSRTQDIGALSIRLAGFEIRDSIAWMYGSGFPKSLDISKAIDKSDAAEARRKRDLQFVEWMRKTNLSAQKCDEILKLANKISQTSNRSIHYFNEGQPQVATSDMFDILRPYLPEVPDYIEKMVAERTIESENFKKRQIIEQQTRGKFAFSPGQENERTQIELDITAPATPEAKQWEGWGTALKPAFEPIVVARKPLIGTVAENVLTYGTGGLNIDGSRIEGNKPSVPNPALGVRERVTYGFGTGEGRNGEMSDNSKGRWPANVILDTYTAELLDEQSGTLKSGNLTPHHLLSESANGSMSGKNYERNPRKEFGGDSGGASRFFYVAKASKRDRNEGLEELQPQRHSDRENAQGVGGDNPRNRTNHAKQNFHPTVKPTDLMRYLVKLVTPPGGVVLDPFTGSGSTGKAAILEGFDFIGIELTEEYLPIIEGRLKHAEQLFSEQEEKKDEALF